MLELSERIMREGYTITVIKESSKDFSGLYTKKMSTGLKSYELPEEELAIIPHLANISELLSKGGILQINTSGLRFQTVIGIEKTEGQYCQQKYLEVHGITEGFDYYDCLINLDTKLDEELYRAGNSEKPLQYKKLYKGENRYE